MKTVLRNAISGYAKQRRPGTDALYSLCKIFLMGYYNADQNSATNGEYALIESLRTTEMKVIFDVGANTGDWTAHMLACFPDAHVHAFELSAETFAKLKQNQTGPRTTLNPFGLSHTDQQISFEHNIDHPDITSIHAGAGLNRVQGRTETRTAETQTGDAYCAAQGIDQIDYLKIDTEGHDIHVLRGFERMLASGKIARIQFEYNSAAIAGRAYLRDFFDLLEKDYTLNRITPKGLVPETYGMFSENFITSNFLALRKDTA